MELKDIENKIKELKNLGYGKTDIRKEIELILYEELKEIMLEDKNKIKYIGYDLDEMTSCLLEHIFIDHFKKNIENENINNWLIKEEENGK